MQAHDTKLSSAYFTVPRSHAVLVRLSPSPRRCYIARTCDNDAIVDGPIAGLVRPRPILSVCAPLTSAGQLVCRFVLPHGVYAEDASSTMLFARGRQ